MEEHLDMAEEVATSVNEESDKAETAGNASSAVGHEGQASKMSMPGALDRMEQSSRIFVNIAKVFILAAIGVLGFWFKAEQDEHEDLRQAAARKTELSKPWLDEALRVLRDHTSPNPPPGSNSPLNNWAVDVFAAYSPVPVDSDLKRELKTGALKFSHMVTSIKTVTCPIELTSSVRDGCLTLKRGAQIVPLEIPDDLLENQVTWADLDVQLRNEEVNDLFTALKVTVLMDQHPKRAALIYCLRDGIDKVESVKMIARVSLSVPKEPIFYRTRSGDDKSENRVYFTADGKPYDAEYGSGSYYTYDYDYYHDDSKSDDEKRKIIDEREKSRRGAFDARWAELKSSPLNDSTKNSHNGR